MSAVPGSRAGWHPPLGHRSTPQLPRPVAPEPAWLDAARSDRYARQVSVLVAFSVTPLGVGEAGGEIVAARAPRVSTVIKADWRVGVQDAMTQKVATVDRYLADG